MIDTSIASSSSIFAVHALSSSQTVFLSGKDIASYLSSLQSDENKLQEIDFETLKTEGAAPAAPAKQAKEKESAKIEGAVQVAVGVKKEVDFAAWYTNVRGLLTCLVAEKLISLFKGPYQSRHAGLL